MENKKIEGLRANGFIRFLNCCVMQYDQEREKLLEILDGEKIDISCTCDMELTALRFLQELKQEIDFENLTEDTAFNLGIKRWSDEPDDLVDGKEIRLLPPYVCALLPENIQVYGLFGQKEDFNFLTCDLDTRMGATAYGILLGV